MKTVTILGATGSIGQSTIDLVKSREDIRVVALTGGANVAQLADDAKLLSPELVVTAFDEQYHELKSLLSGTGIDVASGAAAVVAAGAADADWVMSAIVGAAGLAPGVAALERGATLALANKETMVAAGPIVHDRLRKHGGKLLPVDSEHSALFQLLEGEDSASVKSLTITASGGALRDWPLENLCEAKLSDVSSHPNWNMGLRITIDSASMFNKALEVIEAKELFGFHADQIRVLVHPESIVHGLVTFCDGAMKAHMGGPDMRHAIGYALDYPDRPSLDLPIPDLAELGALTFRAPDPARWPALRLAYEVMEAGGYAGAAFNAAKEAALDAFLAEKIGFQQMAELVEYTLATISLPPMPEMGMDLSTVFEVDAEARNIARARSAKLA